MRTPQPEKTLRDKAIEKARLRVRRDGCETLKLSDVARDLNVTHAALYKYFANKQDLIDAINLQWMRETNSNLQTICNQKKSATTRIQEWFLALYQMRRNKVLSNASEYASYIRTQELHRPCAQQDALERKAQLSLLVQAAIDEGEIRNNNVQEITKLLFCATDYFIHPAFVANHAAEDKKADLKQLLEVLTKGLSRS